MTMPDYRDPKFINPDEWERWEFLPANTTGDYRPLPQSETHTPEWQRVDFPLFSPEEAIAAIRSLVEFIEARGLSAEIEIDIEWARELLARK